MKQVVITLPALGEIAEIGDFIALDNPRRAATFMEELIVACEALGLAPESYPLLAQFKTLGIRRKVHGAYLILFHLRGESVEVLHVLHGARDYGRLLAD